MAFDWINFVNLAREFERGTSQATTADEREAMLRSAISRAYFGAYCHARNYALKFLGFQGSMDVDDHSRLRKHIKDKRRAEVAKKLEVLRLWRNFCDYDDIVTINLAEAVSKAIHAADYVFNALKPPQPR